MSSITAALIVLNILLAGTAAVAVELLPGLLAAWCVWFAGLIFVVSIVAWVELQLTGTNRFAPSIWLMETAVFPIFFLLSYLVLRFHVLRLTLLIWWYKQ